MPSGTVVKNVEDAVAVVLDIFESSQREIVSIAPASFISIIGTFDSVAVAKRFIENGGTMRSITTITPANVDEIRIRLDIGQDVRHSDHVHELWMFIGDGQHSISAINIGVEEYTLDTPVTAFWSESPVYAEYLLASFETAWASAVPAEQRIEELEQQT